MNRVYRKKNFNLYDMGDGYIIHNMNKPFPDGHSHIKNYKTAIYLIDLALNKSIPHHLNVYFLVTLKRISTDSNYISRIDDLLIAKQSKEFNRYYNKPKHFKKTKKEKRG